MLTTVTYVPRTGDVLVDALLGTNRWNADSLTYSFPGHGSMWSASYLLGYESINTLGEPWQPGFMPLDVAHQASFRSALEAWSKASALKFVEVQESTDVQGTIRVAFTALDEQEDSEAWGYFPSATWFGGDVWINSDSDSAYVPWSPGSYSYFTILHELGHALGLKHPFSGQEQLPEQFDSQSLTIMSYSALPGDRESIFSFYPTTPMPLDVQSIQHLYGANPSVNAGDTVFSFNNSRPYHETLVDAWGVDTLQYSGGLSGYFDLRPGHSSRIGLPVSASDASGKNSVEVDNIWIALGTDIENLVAGSGNDLIVGNVLNNHLDGGAGLDTLLINDIVGSFSFSRTAQGWLAESVSTPTDRDTLHNIERVEFSNGNLALDLESGQAANRTLQIMGTIASDLIGNAAAVGIILSRVDAGLSSKAIFEQTLAYGIVADLAGGTSDTDLIWLVGRNILGAQMSQGVVDNLLPLLSGQGGAIDQSEFLTLASELSLNTERIPLMGIYDQGLAWQ